MSPSKGHIVVVDDDKEMRALLEDFLTREGFSVTPFPSAVEALTALRSNATSDVDVIVSDIKMAQMDGMQFQKTLNIERPGTPVILVTAFGSIDTAIEAMKNGAYHYLVKPFKLAEVGVVVERAMDRRRLIKENAVLRHEMKRGWETNGIIGKSPAMRSVFDLIKRVSHSNANVLIHGESGTGKEIVARAIHDSGPRAKFPFIAINCTAIPETLLESELFGHAKGSFTGAINRKKGLIEEAAGGTLFLDEIGDMAPMLQAKLLRVLQERKIRPVGENTQIDVDVRVIAATHKDLKLAIRNGVFREDLFYRLSVIPISLPPLRERTEDIPILAEHFLRKYASPVNGDGAGVKAFTKAALSKLLQFRWTGNVRELENIVERAVVLCQGDYIDASDIPEPDMGDAESNFGSMTADSPTLAQLEQRYIKVILHKTNGRKDRAAHLLGINRRTLYRKEREYGWVEEDKSQEAPDAPEAIAELDSTFQNRQTAEA